jgi:hypothetical protein
MRSAVQDILPAPVKKSLKKLGADIAVARRKRRLTVQMMTERVGVARGTYARVERGDPTVAFGVYAMTLFVLGFGAVLGDLVDARRDELGLVLEEERLPKRVRAKRAPTQS